MVYLIYTYKEGTALSKEKKLAKKEQKVAKKAAKLEKKQAADYAKLVKKIDKKNAKLEKKANKKGKPFVPIAVPTQEEAFAASSGSKTKKIILMIILILLIWYLIYFLVMWFSYVAPTKNADVDDSETTVATYERYSNPHEITTTPDYSVSEAKNLLKQVLHDDWKVIGYSSDPSSGSINYTSNIVTVNNQDCYVFTAGSKTYAVSVKLSAVYLSQNGSYTPLTFEQTDYLFN
jgi:hypothetical protein